MWAILIGTVAMFVFGAVWFTFLFGKTWAKLMDFNPRGDEEAKKMGMVKPMIMNFILNLISVSVVSYLFPVLLSFSYTEFLRSLLIIWLGFSFTIYATAAVWERKSWKLVLINSGQSLISLIIVSAIIFYVY